MTRPQHILADVATTVAIDLPEQPAAATVSLYTGDGAAIFEDEDATVSTIDTTLAGAVSKGGTSIEVAAATGIASGSTPIVATPNERVLVRTIASTTVALVRPLLYDHAIGVAVQGCRLTYEVSAANAATRFWDGRLVWTVTATGRQFIQAACCTEYPFDVDIASEQDLFDCDPLLAEKLSSTADVSRMLIRGGEELLRRLSALTSGRAHTFASGTPPFARAVALAALWLHYQPMAGELAAQLYERYDAALVAELTRLLSGVVYRDADQDGAVESHEQRSARSGAKWRA